MKAVYYEDKKIGFKKEGKRKIVFEKQVVPKKHKMRIFNAYGIQEDVFQSELAEKRGEVIIKEKGGDNRVLKAQIRTWEKEGFVKNMGSGDQRFLRIDKMNKINANQLSLL